jgi:hypothetical protein
MKTTIFFLSKNDYNWEFVLRCFFYCEKVKALKSTIHCKKAKFILYELVSLIKSF